MRTAVSPLFDVLPGVCSFEVHYIFELHSSHGDAAIGLGDLTAQSLEWYNGELERRQQGPSAPDEVARKMQVKFKLALSGRLCSILLHEWDRSEDDILEAVESDVANHVICAATASDGPYAWHGLEVKSVSNDTFDFSAVFTKYDDLPMAEWGEQ